MKKIPFFLGILGLFGFILLSKLAQSLTPGFDSANSPASNLAAGQYGYLQNAALVVGGIGFTLLGYSIYLAVKKWTKGPLLIMLFGFILILESVFQSNPTQNDNGTMIHIALFMIGMIGMLVSTILVGKALKKISDFFFWYSVFSFAVSLIGMLGIMSSQGQVGIYQQIATIPLFLWVMTTSIYTLTKKVQTSIR